MIKLLSKENTIHIEEVALLLQNTFPWCYGEKEIALKESINLCSNNHITFVYLDNNHVVGVVSAQPQYNHTGWELHPLAVESTMHKKGIATQLMHTIEKHVVDHGGIIMYLGSDDEHDKTSLSQIDLFKDPFNAIQNIKNFKYHPYSFYEKLGYKIVGVIPDANGWNKPDIIMAKRLIEYPNKH